MIFGLAHVKRTQQRTLFWPGALVIWFLRARTGKCDDASTCSFFRGRWRSARSLAKMFIFLKMLSFTLFIMDLIRDTSWLQSAKKIMFSNPAFQVRRVCVSVCVYTHTGLSHVWGSSSCVCSSPGSHNLDLPSRLGSRAVDAVCLNIASCCPGTRGQGQLREAWDTWHPS